MKKDQVNVAVAAVTAAVNVLRPRKQVKYLQPYFYQGGRWFKLKIKK